MFSHALFAISEQFSQMKAKGRVIICTAASNMLAMSFTVNSIMFLMPSHAEEHAPEMLSQMPDRKSAMPLKVLVMREMIRPKVSEKNIKIPVREALIAPQMVSHKSLNHSQISPQFSKTRINPAIAATTPAIMAITGPHATRKLPIAGIAVALRKPMNVPIALVIAPTAITSCPIMIKTGARAATIAPITRMVLRVPSSIF